MLLALPIVAGEHVLSECMCTFHIFYTLQVHSFYNGKIKDINPELFQPLQDLTKPHIDSFNALIHGGLSRAVQVQYLKIYFMEDFQTFQLSGFYICTSYLKLISLSYC